MKVNRGKDFEGQIRCAFENYRDTSVIRLLDPQSGYAGVRNICDFIVYHFPNQYFIECKSCYGSSLPFSNITKNQWQGLLDVSKINGVYAGYMIWFIDYDKTVYVSANKMEQIRLGDRKSVRFDEPDAFVITGHKKRVLFDYDMTEFFMRTLTV